MERCGLQVAVPDYMDQFPSNLHGDTIKKKKNRIEQQHSCVSRDAEKVKIVIGKTLSSYTHDFMLKFHNLTKKTL